MNRIKNFLGRLRPPCDSSLKILRLGLPIILFSLVWLTVKLVLEDPTAYSKILFTYPEMYARILAFLAILISVAMIVDVTDKRR